MAIASEIALFSLLLGGARVILGDDIFKPILKSDPRTGVLELWEFASVPLALLVVIAGEKVVKVGREVVQRVRYRIRGNK